MLSDPHLTDMQCFCQLTDSPCQHAFSAAAGFAFGFRSFRNSQDYLNNMDSQQYATFL